MLFSTNSDLARRDALISEAAFKCNPLFGKYSAGVAHVVLDFQQLLMLVQEKFLWLERSHNEAPNAAAFLTVLQTIPALRALSVFYGREHGAANDVFIEGIELPKGESLSQEHIKYLKELCWESSATEYSLKEDGTEFRVWWD